MKRRWIKIYAGGFRGPLWLDMAQVNKSHSHEYRIDEYVRVATHGICDCGEQMSDEQLSSWVDEQNAHIEASKYEVLR